MENLVTTPDRAKAANPLLRKPNKKIVKDVGMFVALVEHWGTMPEPVAGKVMSSNIGRKIILHKIPFPENSKEKDEFVLVSIDKIKEVPCLYNRKEYQEGWRAVDASGNHYYCNWQYFPDDSMTPTWSWQNEQGQAWYDVTQGLSRIPFHPVFVEQFSDIIHYCPEHQRLDYINNFQNDAWINFAKNQGRSLKNPCFDCLIGLEPVGKKEGNWNGWR